MRRLCFLLVLMMLQQLGFACVVVDDLGNTVQLNKPAKKIISLAPDLTEILFAIDAGSKLVGTVLGSDYPEAAAHLPIVATDHSIDAEAILKSHPDLIVAWSETSYIAQLKKLGIPIFLSHTKQLSDIPKTMQRLSCLAGTKEQGQRAAQAFLQQYTLLKKNHGQPKPVTVFYQIWSHPLLTMTKKSWIDEAITLCGGRNIFSDLKGTVAEVDREAVLVANPDLIIGTQHSIMEEWPQTKTAYINPDFIDRAGPRILQGIAQICFVIDQKRKTASSR